MNKHDNNRILFLASSAPMRQGDATSPFILSLAAELQKFGWEVEIIVPHAPGLAREETLQGMKILRYRYMWPERLQTLCYNGGIAQNLRRSRFNLLLVPCLILCGYVFALVHIVKRRHALIHSHWVLPSGLQGRWLQWFFVIPHVVMAHGGDVFAVRGRLARFLKRQVMQTADATIANSTATAAAMQKIAPGLKVRIIPTGVETAPVTTLQVKREAYAGKDATLLVFAGRMVEEKGLGIAIDALELLRREGQEVALLALGDGPDKAVCEARVQRLGLVPHVHFTGAVPPQDVPAYLAVADIFVGPSCTGKDDWVEGQGNSIVEAMVAGIPVVASNIGGIPDAVIHERTGLLVPERDTKALARAILRLMQDKVLGAGLVEQARRHAEREFSRTECARRISATYTELLKG